MSGDSKSFEKKLDKDFLHYLNLTKRAFEKVTSDTERHQCEVWLTHLIGKPVSNVQDKCDRNIFLSRLLLQMQNGQLKGIFLDTPPTGALPCAFTTFGLPTQVTGLQGFEEMGFQVDSSFGGNLADYFESSRDGRTYLATRHLPQGMMAFIAVTNNEGEELWTPQQYSVPAPESESERPVTPKGQGFVKKLAQFVQVPITQLRKPYEEREKVIEWMDRIIDDCNKWIRGEDPHNMDLESLFELLYKDYQQDPEKAEILKHPRKVRNILIRDIREKISERRAEITKRELILDQYEAEEYVEERLPGEGLDEVWLQCAKRPLSESVKNSLENYYPPEVIQRFTELLFQERLNIIEKGEKEASRKIAEMRSGSLEDIKRELQRLKKVQQEYKEYYCVYKDVEEKLTAFEREWTEKCAQPEKKEDQSVEKVKHEIESEIASAKQNFDKERRAQNELKEKLEEARITFQKLVEKMNAEAEKLEYERNQLKLQKEELECQIRKQKKRRDELMTKVSFRG